MFILGWHVCSGFVSFPVWNVVSALVSPWIVLLGLSPPGASVISDVIYLASATAKWSCSFSWPLSGGLGCAVESVGVFMAGLRCGSASFTVSSVVIFAGCPSSAISVGSRSRVG